MTMGRRTRVPIQPRRKRFWTTRRHNLTLSGTTQAASTVGVEFREETGETRMDGVTIARLYLRGFVRSNAAVTVPNGIGWAYGLTWAPFAIAATAIGDVVAHKDDYFHHSAQFLFQPIAATTANQPQGTELQNGMVWSDSEGKRKADRGQDLFLVARLDETPEETITLEMMVTLLWLID